MVSILLAGGLFPVLGCGGGSTGNSGNPGQMVDMATTYMTSFPPTPPQVQKGSGTIIATPKVTPIFFSTVPADPLEAGINSFVQSYITSSNSWLTLQEYGIGHGTVSSAAVLSTTAPTTDTAIQSLIVTEVGNGTLPPATTSSIYIIFTPSNVTVTRGSQTSCVDFGGYHDTVMVSGVSASYAVIPRCAKDQLVDITIAASHELAEAATDPVLTAYLDLNDPYDMWQFNFAGSELADMCENITDYAVEEQNVGAVSRLWSNAAMAAFKNPCLPAPTGADAFAVPILDQLNQVDINSIPHNIEMITLVAGQVTTVKVKLLNNLEPTKSWGVSAMEVPLPTTTGGMGQNVLAFSFGGTAQGANGTTLELQLSAASSAPRGLTTFRLTSTVEITGGPTQTLWVGVVSVVPG